MQVNYLRRLLIDSPPQELDSGWKLAPDNVAKVAAARALMTEVFYTWLQVE
ncbi:MAG: hypothetical protein R6V19_10415 [Armatimonadota bacterium]